MYNSYKYIFPPRPEQAIPGNSLNRFDNQKYIGDPKLNGDCCVVFTNGIELHIMNRHSKPSSKFKLDKKEILDLHRGNGWMVLVGEYMDKSKKDENNKTWNHKLVLFDILVLNGTYLLGTTFEQRKSILNKLYGEPLTDKPLLHKISENVWKTIPVYSDFLKTFNSLVKFDMYEGLVLKMKNAKLEKGDREKNNTKTQVKARKETKNYSH